MKFELPWSWRTYFAFCLLAYLVGATHELAHHVAGFLSSGEVGRMSFNLFGAPSISRHPVMVSLAGPAISYTVAWIGALMLLLGRRSTLGYALVAGSICYMRLAGVLGGGGDESVASRTLTGIVHRGPLVLIVAILVLPPILIAFNSLANRKRFWIFISSMFGPFLPLILVKKVDERWFAANVLNPETFTLPVAFGIPIAVLVSDAVILMLFLLFGWTALQSTRETGVSESLRVSESSSQRKGPDFSGPSA